MTKLACGVASPPSDTIPQPQLDRSRAVGYGRSKR
jgi:hypothetical protein